MTIAARWMDRLDARDRTLHGRWAIDSASSIRTQRAWILVTHAGGATVTIGAAFAPLLLPTWPRAANWRAAVSLAVSHLIVQVVKRRVSRARPGTKAVIECPDRFSFPSGHATASLAIAASYALAFPAYGVPLAAFGLLVGWSRVILGVHYPGDVVAGQLLALATVAFVQVLH